MDGKIEEIVIENQKKLLDLSEKVHNLTDKESHVQKEIKKLEIKVKNYLIKFTRDNYKNIDRILELNSLSTELLVFKKLGYVFLFDEHLVILGLSEMVNGRGREALENYFKEYLDLNSEAELSCTVQYLCGMICYNNGNFSDAKQYYSSSAQLHLSLFKKHDFQAEIYVCECMFLAKEETEKIEKQFSQIELTLKKLKNETDNIDIIFMTLYLKWGNIYFQSIWEIKTIYDTIGKLGLKVDNEKAYEYYIKILNFIGAYNKSKIDTTLKVILVYSLAQAIYTNRTDINLPVGTDQLFMDVFDILKNLLLDKTEGIILAQFYFMLGTCAWYSSRIPKDQGLLFLEYSRKQTQLIPVNTKYYSCMTKKLLDRDSFVKQIDQCVDDIKSRIR